MDQPGYPELANVLRRPGMTILRKFGQLNLQNLLYMQAEITHLQNQLRVRETEDKRSGPESQGDYSRRWLDLSRSLGKPGLNFQWRTMLQIREKLDIYNKSLLQYAQIEKLETPNAHDLKTLRGWLDDPELGNGFLKGREAWVWKEENNSDLLTLSSRATEGDYLTQWILDGLVPWVCQHWRHYYQKKIDEEIGLMEFNDRPIMRLALVISVFLSSLLPTLSIFALYFVSSLVCRLGLIVLFTSIFSLVLAIAVKARRAEIFAATSAFPAVQVVFVGSTR